jgi:hypothetical protein
MDPIAAYFIIGILYVFINGFFRKHYTDGDMLLPMAQMLIWPLFIGTFIAVKGSAKFRKWLNHEGFNNNNTQKETNE